MEKGESIVTPWEVKGEVDYEQLIKQFGVEPLNDELLERLRKQAGYLHILLRRRMFFAHRELGDWITSFEKGINAALYTGRGPSGSTHLGHLIPWIFTKYMQDAFGSELYFQITDDEKYFVNPDLELEEIAAYTNDNLLDIIAVGFDPKKTKIFCDLDYIKELYNIAARVAKHVTFSTAKATFGFSDSSNIGIIFFPAIQAAPCFLPQKLSGRDAHILIPCAIDQEPYWRVTRDVAPKLGYRKPAGVYSKFIPGLGSGGKMSASLPDTAIFLSDSPEAGARKIRNAFTGGQPTIKEQKERGGNPDICVIYAYLYSLFDEDDKNVVETYNQCKSGALMCGSCKNRLAEMVKAFLADHQKKKADAKAMLDQFLLRG